MAQSQIKRVIAAAASLACAFVAFAVNAAPGSTPNAQQSASLRPKFQPNMDLDTAAGWWRAAQKQRPIAVSHVRNKIDANGPRVMQPRSYSGVITAVGPSPDQITVSGAPVFIMNVSGQDAQPEAMKWLQQLVGKTAYMVCTARLTAYGDDICTVVATVDNVPLNIGAKMLQMGVVGWQSEVGYSKDPAAHAAAKSAYEYSRGIWSDPRYFPDGVIRTGPVGRSL